MREARALAVAASLLFLGIGLASIMDAGSGAWAISPPLAGSGSYSPLPDGAPLLEVKKGGICTLCEVCGVSPAGPNKGKLVCFGGWIGKDGCKKRLRILKYEGAVRGLNIQIFCHCAKKPCACKGRECP